MKRSVITLSYMYYYSLVPLYIATWWAASLITISSFSQLLQSGRNAPSSSQMWEQHQVPAFHGHHWPAGT